MKKVEITEPVWLSFWIEVPDKTWLAEQAKAQDTSMSALLRDLIKAERKRAKRRKKR